jgi:hypothetical protein
LEVDAGGELTVHFELDESSGLLVPKTETGRFPIALLHLNRTALVAHRVRASENRTREENLQALAQYVPVLESTIVVLLQIAERLRLLLLEDADASDAPE